MPKLICSNCGWWDDQEEFYWEKDYDDFGWSCPHCGKDEGWLADADQCKVCGDWFGPGDIHGGVCRDCLSELPTKRPDIVLGFLWENRDYLGEYAAEIIDREYAVRDKKTAPSSQLGTVR